jgi:hypothetical protein
MDMGMPAGPVEGSRPAADETTTLNAAGRLSCDLPSHAVRRRTTGRLPAAIPPGMEKTMSASVQDLTGALVPATRTKVPPAGPNPAPETETAVPMGPRDGVRPPIAKGVNRNVPAAVLCEKRSTVTV